MFPRLITHNDNNSSISGSVLSSPKMGNGNNGGGGMEVRIAKLEAHTEHIQSDITEIKSELKDFRKEVKADFRWLIGIGFALIGVIAKGFHWI